jgi:hypothetical protein
MDPRNFLALARDMAAELRRPGATSSPTWRASCRSVISRSYYASFLVAVEFMGQLGFGVPESGAGHSLVQQALNNCQSPDLVTVSGNLRTLYIERTTADYQMTNSHSENVDQVDDVNDLSSETIVALDKCSSECRADRSRANTIANAIRVWAGPAGKIPLLRKK